MCDCLQHHELQNARLPSPSPTPGAYSNSCPSSNLILCCLFLLLPSIFPSTRAFSHESVLRIRWPKYWSFSFSISPSNENSGLISPRIDWLDLLAVQGTSRVFSNTKVQKHIQCKYFLASPHGTTMARTSPSTWKTTPPSGSLDCKIAPSQHALHTTGPCSEPINAGLPAFSKQKYRMPSYVQTTQLTMVYPQFKFNWPSCILSGNFYQWLSAALGSKTSLPASICKPHTTGISLTLCSCLLHSLSPSTSIFQPQDGCTCHSLH